MAANTMKEQTCPNCGVPLKRVRIVYGYPTPEMVERAERGKFVLGGCLVWPDAPKWACADCRKALTLVQLRGVGA